MIKIALKNGNLMHYDGPFDGVVGLFDKMEWRVDSESWLKLGDYILPADQIMYIKDAGGESDD